MQLTNPIRCHILEFGGLLIWESDIDGENPNILIEVFVELNLQIPLVDVAQLRKVGGKSWYVNSKIKGKY